VLNYQYLVLHDIEVAIEVEHWKDCPPLEHDAIFGKTIDCENNATQFGHHRRTVVWLPPWKKGLIIMLPDQERPKSNAVKTPKLTAHEPNNQSLVPRHLPDQATLPIHRGR
jgi:hypothetical protein